MFRKTDRTNQTEFAGHDQIQEGDTHLYQDEVVVEAPPPTSSRKKILIGAAAGLAVILIATAAVLMMRGGAEQAKPEEKPAEEVVIADQDRVTQEMNLLKQDLKLADPSIQVFIFPPVAAEIRIDKER